MRTLVLALVMIGCKPADDPKEDTDDSDTTPTETDTATTDTDTDTDTVEPFDCTTVPDLPISVTQISGARGYHDLAFDPDGFAIGNDEFNELLVRSDYDALSAQPFVPGIGTAQQMAYLPDGDLAVAADEGVMRIKADGSRSTITADVWPYGLIIGPDGMLYTADYYTVQRVDPATGAKETLVDALPSGGPRVIEFGLDYSALYIGTRGGDGDVYKVDLDENLDPIGEATVFAPSVGDGSYHDALGMDVCGNLYLADFDTFALYRISPDAEVTVMVQEEGGAHLYGHGLEWGNGVGGWRTDAIYMPQPYNDNHVVEVVLGVPSAD